MKNLIKNSIICVTALTASYFAIADQVILDDIIVDGSACVGMDCVNGESFGFDTLRLKENNLRIKFDDTSSSASFPSNDWQITINDTNNGGANKFAIDDVTAGYAPFVVMAGAGANSLVIKNRRVGFGTSTPVVELHSAAGNTPTLRLEQNGSQGWTPQTWDVAGNEANFFVRDVTNGSQLPFRIFPNSGGNMLTIKNKQVGVGTAAPISKLHVENLSSDKASVYVKASERANTQPVMELHNVTSVTEDQLMLKLSNENGGVRLEMTNAATNATWKITTSGDSLRITKAGTGKTEFVIDSSGNVTVQGTITAKGFITAP